MLKHKSRKELRLEAAAASSALASLDTPEGLAGLVFEKTRDPEFHVTFREALEKLYDEAPEAPEAPEEEPTDPAASES